MSSLEQVGLELLDREYSSTMIVKFGGEPVGIDTIATAIGEEKGTIEDIIEPYFMIEPYLIQQGFVMRMPRGRTATDLAYQHLGLKPQGKLL